ncbi:hypothetical protein FQN57_000397 [Myotisia sp. PD_48]|nr:hypothetical protein FQN57_000397 [Myotisia sp. PD_48]
MKILDPQSAVLTNVEVLAYLTSNPPHKIPKRPVTAKDYNPKPDLRDHNTVVKEFHDFVNRHSSHLLSFPGIKRLSQQPESKDGPETSPIQRAAQNAEAMAQIDRTLRELITRLKPYSLTKAEVVVILNLGVGISSKPVAANETPVEEDVTMQDTEGGQDNTENGIGENTGADGEEEGPDQDYYVLALLDSIIERREERLTDEELRDIVKIIREVLTGKSAEYGDAMEVA